MSVEVESNDDLFEGVELQTPSSEGVDTSVKDVVQNDQPSPLSPEWNDYVMDLFEEDELFDGFPTCVGLRRVAELLLGRIVASRPTQVFPPQGRDGDQIGRSTVAWEVTFSDGSTYGDVADSWIGNTDDKFVVFNTATAATRAEGRALRKALRLKKCTAEEITQKNTSATAKEFSSGVESSTEGEYNDSARMTDNQANYLDVKASQLNVNVEAFIQETFGENVNRNLDKGTASKAIKQLSNWQSDVKQIPEAILGYQSDWRSTSK